MISLSLQIMDHAIGLGLPRYQTPGAAGMDVCAAVPEHLPLVLEPMQRVAVPTGLMFAVPEGYEIQVRPRSGLALNHGVTVLNAPGTIDSDYRGEVKILLINLGASAYEIRRGERIAQLVAAPVVRCESVPVASLPVTLRGDGGFGSTGQR